MCLRIHGKGQIHSDLEYEFGLVLGPTVSLLAEVSAVQFKGSLDPNTNAICTVVSGCQVLEAS